MSFHLLSGDILANIIENATEKRLRKTLLSVIKDEAGRKLVEDLLVVPSENTAGEGTTAPTRKRARYEMCEQCKQEFDVAEGSDVDCIWHSENWKSTRKPASGMMPKTGVKERLIPTRTGRRIRKASNGLVARSRVMPKVVKQGLTGPRLRS